MCYFASLAFRISLACSMSNAIWLDKYSMPLKVFSSLRRSMKFINSFSEHVAREVKQVGLNRKGIVSKGRVIADIGHTFVGFFILITVTA